MVIFYSYVKLPEGNSNYKSGDNLFDVHMIYLMLKLVWPLSAKNIQHISSDFNVSQMFPCKTHPKHTPFGTDFEYGSTEWSLMPGPTSLKERTWCTGGLSFLSVQDFHESWFICISHLWMEWNWSWISWSHLSFESPCGTQWESPQALGCAGCVRHVWAILWDAWPSPHWSSSWWNASAALEATPGALNSLRSRRTWLTAWQCMTWLPQADKVCFIYIYIHKSLSLSIYIYICIHIHIYIYTYIYIDT